jgi:hypothetical protein
MQQTITNPGMDEYRWYNQDFDWTHTFDPAGKTIQSAKLDIRAWNIDWGPEPYWEHNIIYADGHRIGELTGRNNEWSTTTFSIDPALAAEILRHGAMSVCIDIDSTHTTYWWAATIDWSKLTIEWIPA